MSPTCQDIADILVDYADGQLSAEQASRVAEHLAECESCGELLDALRRSLELAEIVWEDGLRQAETIRIGPNVRRGRRSRLRYGAVAAAVILIVSVVGLVRHAKDGPPQKQPSFAEIERKITEAGSAARLLAAADLLGGSSKAKTIVEQQYRRIVETYPDTPAATKARLRVE